MSKDIVKKEIFRVRVGSHLYGLNTPESDEDFLSVFIPTKDYLLGLKKVEEVDNSTKKSSTKQRNTKADIDDKGYSLPKFLRLLIQNNPNIVEVLFATPDNILLMEPEFEGLMFEYEKIISQKVFHSFTGYAYSQRKHLVVKRERYRSLQGAIEFLEALGVEERERPITEFQASELNRILKFYKGAKGNTESFHKGMPMEHIYGRINYEFHQYGYRIRELNFTGDGGDSYDTKFAYHLIRLLDEGRQLLENGIIRFPIDGKAREDILRIRNKEVPFQALMDLYDEYDNEIREVKEKTKIRHTPDFNWANKYLVDTLRKSIME